MAVFTTVFIALLGLSSTAVASTGVQSYTKHLSEMPRTLNLSNVVHDVSPAGAKAEAKSRSLEKRDGPDCIFPGPDGAAVVEDCNQLCAFFLDNALALATVLPLDIVIWETGTCQFGLANLDPCHGNTVQYGTIVSWCQSMLGQCIINGYDG